MRVLVITAVVRADDEVQADSVTSAMRQALNTSGAAVLGSHWTPDPDTIADAYGVEYGQVDVRNLND